MKIKTIIIANIAEAFEEVINIIENSEQKKSRIAIEHSLCDRTLLWEGDDKVVVTPYKISKEIFNLNKSILKFENVYNLFPCKIDISLSDAIINDDKLLGNISKIISQNPGINISPYCVTEKFIELVNVLRDKNLDFKVNEKPADESEWLVSYLDSKIGSRTELEKIEKIKDHVPESFICQNKNDVIKVARWFFENDRSCALKSNFGESGWGTLFIKVNDYKNTNEITGLIHKVFQNDSIWKKNLTLVEEYIEPNVSKSSGSPSSELFLSSEGVEITYICDQIVNDDGEFLGIAMGEDLLDKKIVDEIKTISMSIGKRFWKLGYRGFFDIDFILSNDNVLYIIETNMRRTGGTHVYDVTRNIFGKKLKKCFAISRDQLCYNDNNDIIENMQEVLYPIKGGKEGVIISIINSVESAFGYIIVGRSKEKCVGIYEKMLKIVNN